MPNANEEYVDVSPNKCHIGKTSFSYRDFYKVALVLDIGKLYYADKWIMVDRPAILFSNPLIPYAWEAIEAGKERGIYCIFNEFFLKTSDRNSSLAESPLLDITKERIYFLDDSTVERVQELFRKMEEEFHSSYAGKSDILRSYLHIIIHEAMKLQTKSVYLPQKNAGQRTAELFLTLLERQFPVEIPQRALTLKTANDYAERLSVHVNHLNRVVKSTTGRTTSTLITHRIVQEGVQLLQHSSYSVAEIAYALGFEEPASFSNFIKKHTNISPTAHRTLQAV
ncbi:helix-turn-helix domain-containing protein [Bacteroides reticulotermitis]|uniref:Transcriptional regulator n=2 Tax=Bacteroides reticulotermitis TaxID=1133319 RepID=W4UWB1_9BACE|nr:helix-turn-helix domain-containing protein [Bacteroides reticulotermitis]MBB4042826.1 AraC-like DNA-binding protein [Bacteroides reticulotermitis]GAE85107.1 transcriptional regulator [Bacteroides reticulotermitis JCM 10512]